MFTQKTLLMFMLRRGAIALAAISIAAVATTFLSGKIHASAETVVAHKNLTAKLQMRNEVVSKLLTEYQNINAYDARIQAALLPVSNILEFVSAIESIAAKDNVTQAARFENPVQMTETIGDPPRSLYRINFSVALQGNVFTFLRYLADIEKLPYFVKINNISFTAQSPAGWLDTSNITMSGTLYTQSDN